MPIRSNPLPSQTELHRMLDYDADTGILRWKFREEMPAKWNTRWNGKIAGSDRADMRRKIEINARQHFAHRIIWKMQFGTEPEEIDHINCDPADNRLANLRAASRRENRRNRPRTKGKTLPKGVYHRGGGRYQAVVFVDGRAKALGSFRDPNVAHDAYAREIVDLYGEFARAD